MLEGTLWSSRDRESKDDDDMDKDGDGVELSGVKRRFETKLQAPE